MPVQDWSRMIAASIVPVALISACGLLCLAFYNRLAAIVTRLRTFQRERLEHHRWIGEHAHDEASACIRREMLEVLAEQTASVTRRARLLRRTLLSLLFAIGCLVVCSVALGLAVVAPHALWVAVPAFLAGALLVLAAVTFAAMEMSAALNPVELEARFVSYAVQLIDEELCPVE